MKMDRAVGQTVLDRDAAAPDADTLVGQPLPRVEGPFKVSGLAQYSAEYGKLGEVAYAVLVPSTVARGRIAAIDVARAAAVPGVLLVMTHANAPPLAARHAKILAPLGDARIDHVGQPVALAVASTFEAATEAASLVRVTVDAAPIETRMAARIDDAVEPHSEKDAPVSRVGDFEGAFARAAVRIDATYTTPAESHAMMEPHATVASWDGGRLTLMTANQMPVQGVHNVATSLEIEPADVRLVSRYIGGGFGGKLDVWPDAILAAMASRAIGRPVKLVLTRPQVFSTTGHRTGTIQRIRIGADAEGRIEAIAHDAVSNNNRTQDHYENAADITRSMYAGPNRLVSNRLVHLDLPISNSMRAPGEAVGSMVLECAMDELAERCGIDPIELRIRNEPARDPENGKPFSARDVVGCYRAGAARFGWSGRDPSPGRVRDGRQMVGMGMAAASRGNLIRKADAKVALRGDGHLVAWLAMTDIGTGSYTILAQIAAEMIGLPIDRVTVLLGDTRYPPTYGSGGSWGASSAGSAVYEACAALRATLAAAAGIDPARARFEDGRIGDGAGAGRPIASLVPAGGQIEATGEIEPGSTADDYVQRSWGAHFAEVGVDVDSGEIRVRRMLGVFGAGRILNRATARSQCLGGMTMGIGAALTEDLVVEPRTGGFVNHNFAEYLMPVHADIPALDVMFLDDLDPLACPIKSKGIGELGICGAGAAVANAVYNATGIRVRDYPITLDKLIPHLVA